MSGEALLVERNRDAGDVVEDSAIDLGARLARRQCQAQLLDLLVVEVVTRNATQDVVVDISAHGCERSLENEPPTIVCLGTEQPLQTRPRRFAVFWELRRELGERDLHAGVVLLVEPREELRQPFVHGRARGVDIRLPPAAGGNPGQEQDQLDPVVPSDDVAERRIGERRHRRSSVCVHRALVPELFLQVGNGDAAALGIVRPQIAE